MAEVLASLKKIGGNGEQYTETVLWTNSAPTSNFGAQAVNLSQSMADFKYLKIKVAPSTTSTSNQYFEDIILVSELQRTQSSVQEGVRDRLVLGLARTTYDYERSYYYASNTSIYFMTTTQSGTNTTNNSRNIPLEILGINELAHGTIKTDFGLLPYSLTESVKVTLGYKPSFVEIKRYKDSTHWAVDTYDANLSSVKQLLGALNGSTKIATEYSVPTTTQNMIASIDDDGFTVTAYQSAAITNYGVPYYRAIGS